MANVGQTIKDNPIAFPIARYGMEAQKLARALAAGSDTARSEVAHALTGQPVDEKAHNLTKQASKLAAQRFIAVIDDDKAAYDKAEAELLTVMLALADHVGFPREAFESAGLK